MSCFKKDGTLKKVYANLVPIIETAEPHHTVITVGRNNTVVMEYDCYRFNITKDRFRYLEKLFTEISAKYETLYDLSKIVTVDLKNYDEVLNIVRQAN